MRSILYSPSPRLRKLRLIVASIVAAGIHLSAIALASAKPGHPSTPSPRFADIDVEPGEPEPPPEPIEIELAPPDTSAPSDFIEPSPARPRSPKKQTQLRARNVSVGAKIQSSALKVLAISAPPPVYPYEARSRRITGSGVILLTVDSATGRVVEATIEESIGNPILDNAAISAFRCWRFRPGSPTRIRIPITFSLTGAQY